MANIKIGVRRALLTLALGLVCLTACGCELSFSPEELYSLPNLPVEYTELNKSIKAILDSGAEYAAPTSGANIQPVQLVDLDGDGQEEALTFFRNPADEKPLKIYVFTARDGAYEQTAVIEGSGTSIYSITYSDLDRDGKTELLVGWRVSTDLQALSVYSLRHGEPEELLRTNYVRYAVTDLEKNQLQDLVVLRSDDAGDGIAEYFGWQDGGLGSRSTARISMTMAELSQQGRVMRGMLRDDVPALFVTGVGAATTEITDILTVKNNELTNVVLSDVTGVSTEIFQFRSLYPKDINSDGITEVPVPVALPSWDNDEPPEYRIDWRSYDIAGSGTAVLSTYHDTEEGWYLQLPDAWRDKLLVSRHFTGGDEVSVTFSLRDGRTAQPKEILTIYTITGDNRDIKAVRDGRVILSRQTETIFAAKLLNANMGNGMTEDELRTAFHLITNEWMTGEN
ncbi:MAG: VCBS repeat-containing protein [Oscillibacter sp.]